MGATRSAKPIVFCDTRLALPISVLFIGVRMPIHCHEENPVATAWRQLSGRLLFAGEVKNDIRFRDAADQPL
jgi:hypothetical protein